MRALTTARWLLRPSHATSTYQASASTLRRPKPPLRLAGDKDGFTAYQLDTADGQPRVWQSADGNAWAEVEQPLGSSIDNPFRETDQQTFLGPDDFARVAGGTVGLIGSDPQPIEGVGSIFLISNLLVQVDGQPGTATIDVAHLGLKTEGWRVPLIAISGNTVVLAQERYWDESPGQQHEAWIITFDNLPARASGGVVPTGLGRHAAVPQSSGCRTRFCVITPEAVAVAK